MATEFKYKIETVTKYAHYFGIDDIKINKNLYNKTSVFLSKPFKNNNKEIEIEVNDNIPNNCSIEYYLINYHNDKFKEYSILPTNKEKIINEKIFQGMPTRFKIQDTYTIKLNNIKTYLKLNELKDKEGLYTIDYIPVISNFYTPYRIKNLEYENILIKAILRKYDDSLDMPYIKSIKVKEYGDDTLWKETY